MRQELKQILSENTGCIVNLHHWKKKSLYNMEIYSYPVLSTPIECTVMKPDLKGLVQKENVGPIV